MTAFLRKLDSNIQLRINSLPNMAKVALNRDLSRPIDEGHFNNNQ
jgi:hypothetical protein